MVESLQKKGDSSKGIPYWKIAKRFIEKVEEENDEIIVSTIVLKEIYFTAKDKFQIINKFFKESDFIDIIKTNPEDYALARKWEEDNTISFYDYLHVAISKRLNLIFITRDKELTEFAKRQIQVYKPEELIS